jgi:hypothetical protein
LSPQQPARIARERLENLRPLVARQAAVEDERRTRERPAHVQQRVAVFGEHHGGLSCPPEQRDEPRDLRFRG